MKGSTILRKVTIKILKITGWLLFSVVILLIALTFAVQIPSVQNRLVQQAVGFLKGKIRTEVRLERISLSFPKKIVLTGVYFEDQAKDTLLYANELAVDTDLWGLLNHEIQLNQVQLDQLTATVNRSSQGIFNFDYIIKAFAGDTTVTDTTSQAWIFSIYNVELGKSKIAFHDSLDGNFANVQIGELAVEMDQFDLEKSIYHADEINLADINALVLQTKNPQLAAEPDSTSNSSSSSPDIRFDAIHLKNIRASYTQQFAGQVAQLHLGEATLDADVIDLKKQVIEMNRISLSNTFLSYHQMDNGDAKKVDKELKTDSNTSQPWKIRLDELDLSGLALQYYDFRTPSVTSGIDFNHLWISDFDLQADHIAMDGENMNAEIESLMARDKSGFAITSAEADLSLTPHSITISDLNLNTPASRITLQAKANFASLGLIGKNYADAYLRIAVENSRLSVSDLMYFQPHFLDDVPLKLKKSSFVHIDAVAHGKMKDLNISQLNLQAFDSTSLIVRGSVKGLPDFDKINMDIRLDKFYTTRKDVDDVVPDSLLPASVHLPRWINLSGDFKGTLKTPDVHALLRSSAGTVDLTARMNLDSTVTKENYTGKLNVKDFYVGNILGDSTMGKLDMTASIKGAGLKLNNLNALFDVTVHQFVYKNYAYKNFKLNGSMKKYFFSGTALLEDKNLDFMIKGDMNYNDSIPDYKLTFVLKNADLGELHLSERPLKARGTLDVDFATSDFKVINGDVTIRKFGVYNGEALYMVDSLLFASIDQKGESKISIRSDILDGDFKGTINLYSLPQVVRRHFNSYFSLNDTTYDKPVAPQNFEFKLVVKDTDLFTEVLFPDLEPFIPGEIAGEFDSEERKLDLRFGISKIRYGSMSVDSLRFNVISDKKKLNYSFSLRNLAADTLHIAGLRFSGNVANDSLRTRLTVLDSVREEKYIVGGVINSYKNSYRFRLLADELLLNYKEWTTPEDNYVLVNRTGLQPHHFEVGKENQKISLLKKTGKDSALSLVFQHLDLKDMTSLVEGITPITGIADGDLTISAAERGAFSSKLRISQFSILSQTWGDLVVSLNKTTTSPYNIDLGIKGEKVNMKITGTYHPSDHASVDITAELSTLNLEALQPLTLGTMKRMDGSLSGKLKVKGNLSRPGIDGTFTFKNASFVPSAVNSVFKLDNETIKITEEGIDFNKLKILDEKNNVASIDGEITTKDLTTFVLNLDVRADHFQLLNSTKEDNDLFFGKVEVTTRMRIRGTSEQPKVTMEVSLGDKSNFNFVVPQSEKGIQEQKGIVTFVDKDAYKDPFLASIQPSGSEKPTSFHGIDLTANIDLTDGETFNIIIDPATGDKLSVKGNAALTFNMNASGDMTLAGRYEITSGSYDFSFYKLVKRNFIIEKGSTITWYGDPMEAQMNIKALYKVETSPMELVSNRIDIANPQEVNRYKQRIPFFVYLMIQGELLAPQISFSLDMPADKQNLFGGNVYATIQDLNTRESDLNKQVFALLVLKRFIAENPFDSQGGGDLGNSARTSVSQILTEQLNRLSQNIKGVQLSFDLKSYDDYSNGTAQGQTQFQLGLSKTLFNDRLVVKVSGNLDIEGQDAAQQNSAADYIGDLALEYKITEDGRFRITGFRNGNYDMIDGELTETGAGLIYIKDYNAFSELFRANEKEKP